MLAFVDPLSGYAFTIHAYQWGWTDGREFVTREYGTTPFGAWYRQGTEYEIRSLTVRFVGTDDVIEQLQMMSMLVMRHGGPVQFYPDAADTSTYFSMIWPETLDLGRVIENREEAELVLPEALPVVPPPVPSVAHVSQYVVEVMFGPPRAAKLSQMVAETMVRQTGITLLSQMVVEVAVRPRDVRLTQMVIEVAVRPPDVRLTQFVIEVMIDT